MRRALLITLLLLLPSAIYAAGLGSVVVKAGNWDTRESLDGVWVWVDIPEEGRTIKVTGNERGVAYLPSVPVGRRVVHVGYPGLRLFTYTIQVRSNTTQYIDAWLLPTSVECCLGCENQDLRWSPDATEIAPRWWFGPGWLQRVP